MPAKATMSSSWRKQPTILMALICGLCLGIPAFAQGPDAAAVTILRGSSAPPPPPAPTTIVQRKTVIYQPVYLPPPDYYAYYSVPIFVQRFPHHHAGSRVGVATTGLPNGWPLLRR